MMNVEILTLYVLICSTGLLLAAASIAVLRFQKKTLDSQAFWDSLNGSAMKADNDNARSERERLLEIRLAALQKTVDELSRREKVVEAPAPVVSVPFENAVRMAKQGATVEELTRACGLSLGEARLVQRMHGRNAA